MMVKFNVNFSAAGDDINFTLWLDVDSSDAYQLSVLARFNKDGRYLSKPPTFEYAKKTTGCRERGYVNSFILKILLVILLSVYHTVFYDGDLEKLVLGQLIIHLMIFSLFSSVV